MLPSLTLSSLGRSKGQLSFSGLINLTVVSLPLKSIDASVICPPVQLKPQAQPILRSRGARRNQTVPVLNVERTIYYLSKSLPSQGLARMNK